MDRRLTTSAVLRGISAAAFLGIITGCASIPSDFGESEVDAMLEARGFSVPERGSSRIDTLTAEPLSAASAVRLALINNPELSAIYARLGLGAAELYEASRIDNPSVSLSWLEPEDDAEQTQRTIGVVVPFLDVILLPARTRLAKGEFAALRQQVGAAVLALAAEAEHAFYDYQAALQVYRLRERVRTAARLSTELAERFDAAGNMEPKELALHRAAAAEAQLDLLEAEAEMLAIRTELANLLGLSVGADWSIEDTLSLPVPTEDALSELLALASESRLDLAAARIHADVAADRLGVTRWSRWFGDVDLGYEWERETSGERLRGPELELELPLFNQHADELWQARAELAFAVAERDSLEVQAMNAVRLAQGAVTNARDRVDVYRSALIPARVEAVARAQEEQNFMLIGVFELIEIKQEEYDTYVGYLESLRDYWQSRVDLALAVGTVLPSTASANETLELDALIAPPPGMDHSEHGSMDHSEHRGMDHSEHGGMDHSEHSGMDHSEHGGMDHSEHGGMDHSEHDGMDHSEHADQGEE